MEPLEKAILIVGKIASGKSTIAKEISARYQLPIASFGSYLKNYSLNKGLSTDRHDLQNLGEDFILKDPGYFLSEVIKFSNTGNRVMIFEGVRHKVIFDKIKQTCPAVLSIFVDVPDETRHKRFLEREKDIDSSKSKAEFLLRNSHPVELEIETLKDLCDINIATFDDDLSREIESLLGVRK